MHYRIADFPETKLIGMNISMSFSDNKTFELWRNFMPRRKEISAINPDLFSIQMYSGFTKMTPETNFEKWAAVPVSDFSKIPEGMETFVIPSGKYAVFSYVGPASEGAKAFGYIFNDWLPTSGFQIDDRPHFEILGEKYSNSDPNSEEEIWIPIV